MCTPVLKTMVSATPLKVNWGVAQAFEKDHCHEVLTHGWACGSMGGRGPARRYCSCLDKVWRGSGDAEGGGNGQVRCSEGESLGIANYLNAGCTATPVRNIGILREAAWGIEDCLQDERRCILGRGGLFHPVCHHACPSARTLLLTLQKLLRGLGGLGPSSSRDSSWRTVLEIQLPREPLSETQ